MVGLLIQTAVGSVGGRGGWLTHRPGVGVGEDAGALGVKSCRLAVVDGGRGHQADPGVAVLVVVHGCCGVLGQWSLLK